MKYYRLTQYNQQNIRSCTLIFDVHSYKNYDVYIVIYIYIVYSYRIMHNDKCLSGQNLN